MRPLARLGIVSILVISGCAFDGFDHRTRLAERGTSRNVDAQSDPALEVFALGATATPAGAIAETAVTDHFARGSSVYLSVNVESASVTQTIEVEWRDGSRVVRRETREAALSREYVLFESGSTARWNRGSYQAVVFIDGRQVALKTFTLS